jgi:uncharacterized protein (AIM24 family)
MKGGLMEFKIHGDKIQYLRIKLKPEESITGDMNNMISIDNDVKIDMTYLHMFNKILNCQSYLWVNFENKNYKNSNLIFSRRKEGTVVTIDMNNEKVCFNKLAFLCSNLLLDDYPEHDEYSKATGTGVLMLHADGNLLTKVLDKNELINLNKNSIIAITESVSMSTNDPQTNQLHGPGRIWLQSSELNKNERLSCAQII